MPNMPNTSYNINTSKYWYLSKFPTLFFLQCDAKTSLNDPIKPKILGSLPGHAETGEPCWDDENIQTRKGVNSQDGVGCSQTSRQKLENCLKWKATSSSKQLIVIASITSMSFGILALDVLNVNSC